jgi:hypothetical protein
VNQADSGAKTVDFFTITGYKIPLCEKVSDLNDFPILCQINQSRIFAINFSHETSIEHVDNKPNDEERFFRFASGIGLKGYQRFLYGNFAHGIMNALPGNKLLTKADIQKSISQIALYHQEVGYQVKGSLTSEQLSSLKQR